MRELYVGWELLIFVYDFKRWLSEVRQNKWCDAPISNNNIKKGKLERNDGDLGSLGLTTNHSRHPSLIR